MTWLDYALPLIAGAVLGLVLWTSNSPVYRQPLVIQVPPCVEVR